MVPMQSWLTYKNELNRIIINNPDAPASVIQQKVKKLNVAVRSVSTMDPDSLFQKTAISIPTSLDKHRH